MNKVVLTDRFILSPKRVPPTGRVDFHDALVPGLSLRVTSTGHRSFNLIARFPANPKHPTRRALGTYGAITLDEARQQAREWLALIRRGTDPKIHAAKAKAAEQRKNAATFGAVAAAFIDRHVSKLAQAKAAQRIIEQEFVARWRDRPVTDVMPDEIAKAIRAIVDRGSPYQAHNALGFLRRLFNWAIGTHEFGIDKSPVERLRPADLIGKREARDRVLTDDEIRAIWAACDEMAYPYGPLIRLMILTGQREHEVADAAWSEFDLDNDLWTVPASRMKGKRAHVVPLADEAGAIFRGLPLFDGGDHVFSTTDGAKPVNGFSKAKARIDRLSGVTDWKFHDIRRTMRTHLSALAIEDRVREAMIAHAAPGLHRVYDKYEYLDEKRRGFGLWEQRLRGILTPKPPAEIANIEAERARRA